MVDERVDLLSCNQDYFLTVLSLTKVMINRFSGSLFSIQLINNGKTDFCLYKFSYGNLSTKYYSCYYMTEIISQNSFKKV